MKLPPSRIYRGSPEDRILKFACVCSLSVISVFANLSDAQEQPAAAQPNRRFEYVAETDDRLPPSYRRLPAAAPAGYDESSLLSSLPADSKTNDDIALGFVVFGAANSRNVAIAVSTARADTLFVDLDRNGQFDEGETIGESDANGIWSFELGSEFPAPKNSFDHVKHQVLCKKSRNGKSILFATAGYYRGKTNTKIGRLDVIRTDFNNNGRWADPNDRFLVDLNLDGSFDLISERFAIATSCLIAGESYNIGADDRGAAFSLSPSIGNGSVQTRLSLKGDSATLTRMSVTLVSDAGIQIYLTQDLTPVTAPAGNYRLSSLRIETLFDQSVMTMDLAREPGSTEGQIKIGVDELTEFDPIGQLQLSSTTELVDDHGVDQITVYPIVRTSTGCYLVDSRVGSRRGDSNRAMSESFHGDELIDSDQSGFS